MSDNIFRGAGVALITPFNNDYSVDFESLDRIVELQLAGGTNFLVILGTTAETSTLKHSEKQQIINFVTQRTKGKIPVMVGIGGNNTSEIVEQLQSTNLAGTDGILSVVPYYSKPTQEGIFRHYMAIADASPLPLILYNVPGRTGVSMCADTTIRLAKANRKIIATKEASGNFADIYQIINDKPENFTLLSGDDLLIAPTTAIGGEGVISVLGNSMPEIVSHLTHCAMTGNFSEASKLQIKINRLLGLLFKEGNPAGIKAALHSEGIIKNILRLPLTEVSEATYNEIAHEILKLRNQA